ncbi:MAG: tetratricopeptide repeat protein [Acidobacteriota bacterium]
MKIKIVLVIAILLVPALLLPRTVVFPFKVNSSENKSHQWLGRGISLYLSYGLRVNGVDTFSDNEGRGLLKSLNIKFPYNVSKASIIRAAKLMRAERLIWGEITTSPESDEETLSIRTFIVDLKNLKQRYLPVLKGKLTGLFSVKKDLLGNLVLYTAGSETTPHIPELKFDLRNYELFIKALLLDDNEKQIVLLEKVRSEMEKTPEILLFELARVYFLNNDTDSAKKLLNEIDAGGQFKGEKFFLSGIINYISSNIDEALSDFTKVLDCGECRHEVLNNISLIQALGNEYIEAMDSIKRAVRSGMLADSFFNAVNIATLHKDRESAWNFLMEGLLLYPSDEDLIALFFDTLKQSPYKTEISPAFIKFLPGSSPQSGERKIFFKLVNPFVFSERKYDMEFPNGNGSAIFVKGADEESIDEVEKKLINNPFLPENHSKLASFFIKEKKLKEALTHAFAALYLLRNPANFMKVLIIIRKQGDRDKLKDMLIEALKYFPDNEDFKNFSLNQK